MVQTKNEDAFLDETIKAWRPRCKNRKLTREDAHEITADMAGFFQVLREWDRIEREEAKSSESTGPLPGLEPKNRIISTMGYFIQTVEMRNICRSGGRNWRIW
jgi:hypothetical protein